MQNITYRKIRTDDYATIKKMISDAFDIHLFTEKPSVLNSALEIYLRDSLSKTTYNQVAVNGNEVIGIIFGRAKNQPRLPGAVRHKILSILHQLKILFIGFSELKKLVQYYQVSKAYQTLKKEATLPLSGEITLFIVSDKYRGQGIGKALFNNFKNYLRAANCQYFYLFTDTNCNYMFYEGQKMLRHGTRNITLIKKDKPHPIDIFMYTGDLSVSQNNTPPRT